MSEPTYDVLIERKETMAEGVVQLTLRNLDSSDFPAWEPGAHIDVLLQATTVRQYSLCGDPKNRSRAQVAILRDPAGRGGSIAIHDDISEGTVLNVRGPRNHFPLAEASHYVFIAGGIGITPIIPMVATVAARGASWELVYGGRSRTSMAYATELVAMYGPERVTVCPQDETGIIDLAKYLGTPRSDAVVYCCGPEPLLRAVEQSCENWPLGTLHVERFSPRTDIEASTQTPVEVELALTGISVMVAADESILDAVRAVGVEVDSSCEEGTCGTCETVVLEGEPEHRDSVLGDFEKLTGDTMMICVSRAKGCRLVLEL